MLGLFFRFTISFDEVSISSMLSSVPQILSSMSYILRLARFLLDSTNFSCPVLSQFGF